MEKRGIFVLLTLLVLVYVLPEFLGKDKKFIGIDSQEQQYLDSLLMSFNQESLESNKSKLFNFDPNKVNRESLIDLGFSKYQANKIINYREKGGVFRKKKDLLKIYGIDSCHYQRVANYINIPKGRKKKYIEKKKSVLKKLYLFAFNPNQIDIETWDSLGIERRVAKRIRKYINAGGKFQRAEDLYKMYGIDSARVKMLIPYIILPKKESKILLVELNGASQEDLMKLSGIGKVLSKRIVDYREKLGGFYSLEQLLEIYGMKKEVLERNSKKIKLDSNLLRKLNLNRCSERKMTLHPYLSSYQVHDIVRYRERNGKFKDVFDLKNKKILPDSIFIKIKAYLLVD